MKFVKFFKERNEPAFRQPLSTDDQANPKASLCELFGGDGEISAKVVSAHSLGGFKQVRPDGRTTCGQLLCESAEVSVSLNLLGNSHTPVTEVLDTIEKLSLQPSSNP